MTWKDHLATYFVLYNYVLDVSLQGIQFLKSITDNQMAQLTRIKSFTDKSGCFGDLYVNNTSLVDAMLQSGYCSTKPSMKKPGPGKQGPVGSHGPMPPSRPDPGLDPMSMNPGPQMMCNSMFAGPSERSGPLKGPQRDQRNTVSPLANTHDMMGPGMGQPDIMNQQPPFPMKMG